ncbi:unnamed protein product [Adineta steineri]|uniref:C2H2-type domain-containing protein n=1 Tax=Adineta steineri TaxID=433720 RepID=A0A813XWV7_9BILA|nr:unnamed protein product [Adineta steineri]CAF0871466.1 unnamed protein product [Adineta steineri]
MITSSTSPIIIPISSVIQVLGRNYDESILLTSKYNQSLLRDRRHRISDVFDGQTGIQQKRSSHYHQISDRVNVTRADQICVYPRRSYYRQTRYNPYLLTSFNKQTSSKIDLNETNESIKPFEEFSTENFTSEIKTEPLLNTNDDQVVILNESIQSTRISKRRMIMNFDCQNCNQKFKNKNQLQTHLMTCQDESKQNEQINRRHNSKNESLLVSLLKQEAMTEKTQQQQIKTNQMLSNMFTQPIVTIQRDKLIEDALALDSTRIQIKLEKKDTDFIIKKQRNSKKTTNKTQSQAKPLSLITCTMCGGANMNNDELIRCSQCEKSMHAYKCLNFENTNIVKTIKTYAWQCIDCKKCIQCGTVEHDDELLFCDYCDRAYHMDCLNPRLSEPPPGECFIVAVELGHSKVEFPFVSRSSTDSPESCIYSQIINFASFVLVITIYIRYRQIAELIRNNPTCGVKYSQSNLTFLICGITSAFSMSIISNFPHANVFPVRLFATYLTFVAGVGALYCEMLLSIWIRPLLYSSRILPIIRTILTAICTLALIAFIVFQTITVVKYNNEQKLWTPASSGWICHLCTIISAWILTSFLLIYMFTLIIDFRRIKIISPKIFLTNDIIDDQD